MSFISKLAIAAVLATGVVSAVAVEPATAQKKAKKGEQGGGLKLSEPVRKPVAEAQKALAAKDYPTALTHLATAEPLAQSDDEKYIVAALRLQATAPSNDVQKLSPILDVLIVNPRTPQDAVPQYNYFRGQAAFQQKKYAEALPYLTKARDLGYKNENLSLQIAMANVETGNVAAGLAAIDRAIADEGAAGRKAPEEWYNYAIQRTYGRDSAAMSDWLQKKVSAYPTPKNWREAILIYRDGRDKAAAKLDRGQQLDLFRLLRATKALADRGDYLEYADLAYLAGLPGEAKTVIDEGRAIGKLPASDASVTRLYADVNTALKNDGSLSAVETKARAAANGRTALATGDAYLGLGNTAKAIEMYQLAMQKGSVDMAEANMHLGVAYAQAGQRDQAKAAFQAITAAGPRKDLAVFWLMHLDMAAGAAPAAGQ
ncbi:tetratricopeptide repeat protein [Sphingomonas sp.]|uniref:tetratricopeptide repeat protein n=1 Tax=Sphingomonas sp. TaxID=28214 RepID=UPI002DD65386|nr:tetratricopeptide repeat protein [Sphingomonas sp.]